MKKNPFNTNFVKSLGFYLNMNMVELAEDLGIHRQQTSVWGKKKHINTDLLEYATKRLEPEVLHAMLSGHFEHYGQGEENEKNHSSNSDQFDS